MQPARPIRIVQISDTHLYDDPEKDLLGVKTQASFAALLNVLRCDPLRPDIILLTGDLSQDGKKSSYQNLAKQFQEFDVPVYCIPGNHDNAEAMAATFPHLVIRADKHIMLKEWDLILLNSQKPGAVAGHLDASQISYLESCLQKNPKHHAIIVFHHHPVPMGSIWLDNLSLLNATAFWQKISAYPRVHTILFGHVHQEYAGQKNGVQLLGSPSTCIQFKRRSDRFAIEKLPPGYRWIELYSDGVVKSGVVRAAEYVGVFDPNSKGY